MKLTNAKVQAQRNLIILKLLLNTRLTCIIFMNFEEYNPDKERKVLIIFDDMIADMLRNKKFIQQ